MMRIGILDPNARRCLKATERAKDEAARRSGKGDERHVNNRFVPNSRDWEIKTVPAPQQGIQLD